MSKPRLCGDCLRKYSRPYLQRMGLSAPLYCPDCGNRLVEDLTVPQYVHVPRLFCLNCLEKAKRTRVKRTATIAALNHARERLLPMKESFPEFLDLLIREMRTKETTEEQEKNQEFYDFLARALLEEDSQ